MACRCIYQLFQEFRSAPPKRTDRGAGACLALRRRNGLAGRAERWERAAGYHSGCQGCRKCRQSLASAGTSHTAIDPMVVIARAHPQPRPQAGGERDLAALPPSRSGVGFGPGGNSPPINGHVRGYGAIPKAARRLDPGHEKLLPFSKRPRKRRRTRSQIILEVAALRDAVAK